MMKRRAAIFDMDGTLADVSELRALHLVPAPGSRRKDFNGFHSGSVDAPAHGWVVRAAQDLHTQGLAILIVTARKAMWRHHTAMWLALNEVPSDRMYMRRNEDSRKDYLVKKDILDRIRVEFEPVVAYDDNPNVLRLWEESGIPIVRVPGWVEDSA